MFDKLSKKINIIVKFIHKEGINMKEKSQLREVLERLGESKGSPSRLMDHPCFQEGPKIRSWMRPQQVTLVKVSGPKKPFKVYSGSEEYLPKTKSSYRHTFPIGVEKSYGIKFVGDNGTQMIFILLPKPAPKKVDHKKLSPIGRFCVKNDPSSKATSWLESEVWDVVSALEFICNNKQRGVNCRQIVIRQNRGYR